MMNGAEHRLPSITAIWEPSFLIPLICYFLLFQLVGLHVRTRTWTNYSGFKQYRLRNLTICLIHSLISGSVSLTFLITHQHVMFHETMHWYSPWGAQLPILSIAYFISDSMDMLRNEISRWTIELLLHHAATVFVLSASVLSRKFIPYAFWALLMEVNRFVIFRFFVQIWQISWAWANKAHFHLFYQGIAFIGGTFFLIINILLFVRVLASDGYLGKSGHRWAAIGRDSQQSGRMMGDTKNS